MEAENRLDVGFHCLAHYYQGFGVQHDHAEAARWCRKAAESKDRAKRRPCSAPSTTTAKAHSDLAEALLWLRKTAQQGHDGAQYNTGLMYGSGEVMKQDVNEAAQVG